MAILTPHERAINLVLWHQQWLMSDAIFRLKFALKLTHPFEKRRLRQISAYNVSSVRDSKNGSLWWKLSRPRTFQRAINGERALPLSPERVAQKMIFSFFWNKSQQLSNCWWYPRPLCTEPARQLMSRHLSGFSADLSNRYNILHRIIDTSLTRRFAYFSDTSSTGQVNYGHRKKNHPAILNDWSHYSCLICITVV